MPLTGDWDVYCPKCGQKNRVTGVTNNHTCTTDNCNKKTVNNGAAYVVCVNGHYELVEGVTSQHTCSECGVHMP
jgi:hypothetical protein